MYSNNFNNSSFSNRGNRVYRDWNGKRRSQCKLLDKGNVVYITGWKVGKRAGFRTFFIAPAKHQRTIVSKSGNTWLTCRVSVENKTFGSTGLFPAFWNKSNNKVICKSLGLIFNPVTGYISYIPNKN